MATSLKITFIILILMYPIAVLSQISDTLKLNTLLKEKINRIDAYIKQVEANKSLKASTTTAELADGKGYSVDIDYTDPVTNELVKRDHGNHSYLVYYKNNKRIFTSYLIDSTAEVKNTYYENGLPIYMRLKKPKILKITIGNYGGQRGDYASLEISQDSIKYSYLNREHVRTSFAKENNPADWRDLLDGINIKQFIKTKSGESFAQVDGIDHYFLISTKTKNYVVTNGRADVENYKQLQRLEDKMYARIKSWMPKK